MFYINVPIGIVAVLLGLAAIVEAGDDTPVTSTSRAPSASGGLSLLVFGLIKAPEWGWMGDPGISARRRAGARRVRHHRAQPSEPLLPLRLFSNRSLTIGSVVVTVNFFALFGALFFMTLFLQNLQGFSPLATGVRTLPLSAAMVVPRRAHERADREVRPRLGDGGGLLGVAGAGSARGFPLATARSGRRALLGVGIGLVRDRQFRRDRGAPLPTTPGWPAGCRARRSTGAVLGTNDPGLGVQQGGRPCS